MTLASGARLCFECRYEWTGDGVPATTTDPPLLVVPAEDDYLGPPAEVLEADRAQAELDALVGTDVILDGGQVAKVVEFPDDDHVTVDIAHGDDVETVTVDWNDVVRSLPRAPEPTAQVDEVTQRAIAQTLATVTGMILQAALDAVVTEDDRSVLTIPASGWMPQDAEALMMLEQGAAYAAAALIYSFELPRDQVADVITQLSDNANNETERAE
jgi:hypothetical protein